MYVSKLLYVVTLVAFGMLTGASGVFASASGVIPGQYIVVLHDTVGDSAVVAESMGRAYGLTVGHAYGHALKGFSATIPAARLAALKADTRVAFVSEDRVMTMSGKPTGGGTITQPPQSVPTGIARIGGGNGGGSGMGVAVIDTGIDLTHPDLSANISSLSKTCVTRTKSAQDDNGHGTHVAGTIAALSNAIGVIGVAPSSTLYAVKVLDRNGSGSWSSVICGIDFVTAHADKIQVANMSLGGPGTSDNNCGNTNGDALHKAICNSVAAGVTYVVAAGNDGANASGFVPAAYDDAVITVSALADYNGIADGDTFASFSNYGGPVDIAAPGTSILSTWKGGAYATISGTSMATPHVAGAAALYLFSHAGALWTDVRDGLAALGEVLGEGHTDPSGLHPEPVLRVSSL